MWPWRGRGDDGGQWVWKHRDVKGVIFNLLEQVVSDAHGPKTWELLLRDTGLDGTYTSIGSYPDEDLLALVRAGSNRLGVAEGDLIRWFGEASLPLLAERYPEFFEDHTSLSTFLPTLNDVIHAEVRKLYPEAVVPVFGFVETTPDRVVMTYDSPRRMCPLAEGFIDGAAEYFDEKVDIEQPECMLRGDAHCIIEVSIVR